MHLRLRRPAVALLASTLAAGVLAASPAHAADGTLSGVVTSPGLGPVDGVTVQLYEFLLEDQSWVPVDSEVTGANGSYSFTAPSSSYRVGFVAQPADDLVPEFYSDARTVDEATTVVLAGGGTAVVNAELARAAHVTGTVVGPGGQPVGDIGVLAVRSRPGSSVFFFDDFEGANLVGTADDGTYDLGALPAGTYRVGFLPFTTIDGVQPAVEWFDDQPSPYSAKDLTVSAGQVLGGVNAVVARGSVISGTVTGADGAPLAGVGVTALTKVGQDWKPVNAALTAFDGTYSITALGASTYRVRFDTYREDESVAATEYWQDKGLVSNATNVPLAAGQTASGIDAKIVPGEHAGERRRVVQNTAVPTIAGTPVVGGTLTASAGTWTPTPTSYAFQWTRDDQPILGAISATYVATEADLGKRLAVLVTATEEDSDGASARSVATAPVQPSAAMVEAGLKEVLKGVRLKGKAKVGTTVRLTGLDASFRAPVTTKVRYRIQWYAGSKKIKKATKTRLRLTPAVRGKKISVKVTALAGATKVSRKLILGKAR